MSQGSVHTSRSEFLDAFIKASPDLGTVFLNHSGSPARLLTDLQVIEVLATKKSFRAFHEFALAHPLVSKVDIIVQFRKKEVWVELTNGTALHFLFIHEMIAHSLSLISVREFYSTATVNEFGMLSIPVKQQFEYLTISVQFKNEPLPDRFRTLFSTFDNNMRRVLFTHIQSKFNLVLSVIEDLYEPEGHFKYRMIVGLRHERRNSLLMLAVMAINQGLFGFLRIFTPRRNTLVPDPGQQKQQPASTTVLRKAQDS